MSTNHPPSNALVPSYEDGRLAFMDDHLRDALTSRTKPHAFVALQAVHLLTSPEMEAIRLLPLDDGRSQAGSRNLLALAQYGLFLEELKRDAFGTTSFEPEIITEKAVENLVVAVRNHLADARTIQDLQRVMGYQATGRTDLSPGDRTAWSLAWRALLSVGQIPEGDERNADNFTYLLQTAQTWLLDGTPWTRDKDTELNELAAMLFVGVATPSREASESTSAQQAWVEAKFPNLASHFGPNFADLLADWGVTGEDVTDVTNGAVMVEILDPEA